MLGFLSMVAHACMSFGISYTVMTLCMSHGLPFLVGYCVSFFVAYYTTIYTMALIESLLEIAVQAYGTTK